MGSPFHNLFLQSHQDFLTKSVAQSPARSFIQKSIQPLMSSTSQSAKTTWHFNFTAAVYMLQHQQLLNDWYSQCIQLSLFCEAHQDLRWWYEQLWWPAALIVPSRPTVTTLSPLYNASFRYRLVVLRLRWQVSCSLPTPLDVPTIVSSLSLSLSTLHSPLVSSGRSHSRPKTIMAVYCNYTCLIGHLDWLCSRLSTAQYNK